MRAPNCTLIALSSHQIPQLICDALLPWQHAQCPLHGASRTPGRSQRSGLGAALILPPLYLFGRPGGADLGHQFQAKDPGRADAVVHGRCGDQPVAVGQVSGAAGGHLL
jgi:hypothetical protein